MTESKFISSFCMPPPPALQTARTISHAYLTMQIEKDPDGYPMLPKVLPEENIDISLFINEPNAVRCFETMIASNVELKTNWQKAKAAIDYFRGPGNTDGNPNIISWGELNGPDGYDGDATEIHNAYINIKCYLGLLQQGLKFYTAQASAAKLLEETKAEEIYQACLSAMENDSVFDSDEWDPLTPAISNFFRTGGLQGLNRFLTEAAQTQKWFISPDVLKTLHTLEQKRSYGINLAAIQTIEARQKYSDSSEFSEEMEFLKKWGEEIKNYRFEDLQTALPKFEQRIEAAHQTEIKRLQIFQSLSPAAQQFVAEMDATLKIPRDQEIIELRELIKKSKEALEQVAQVLQTMQSYEETLFRDTQSPSLFRQATFVQLGDPAGRILAEQIQQYQCLLLSFFLELKEKSENFKSFARLGETMLEAEKKLTTQIEKQINDFLPGIGSSTKDNTPQESWVSCLQALAKKMKDVSQNTFVGPQMSRPVQPGEDFPNFWQQEALQALRLPDERFQKEDVKYIGGALEQMKKKFELEENSDHALVNAGIQGGIYWLQELIASLNGYHTFLLHWLKSTTPQGDGDLYYAVERVAEAYQASIVGYQQYIDWVKEALTDVGDIVFLDQPLKLSPTLKMVDGDFLSGHEKLPESVWDQSAIKIE